MIKQEQSTAACPSYGTASWVFYVERYGMMIVLVALFVAAGFLSPHFLNLTNLVNLSRQVAAVGILSVGMTLAILTGGIDLTVGSTLALSAVLLAKYQTLGPAALLISLAAGAACAAVGRIATRGPSLTHPTPGGGI